MTEWTCKRCGMCCGIVPFEPADYEKAKGTGVQFEPQMISGHLCYIPKAALKTGRCPFYNRKKKICTIYKDRPQVCRDFGDGPHPCLVCPHNPRHNPEQINAIAERIIKEQQ